MELGIFVAASTAHIPRHVAEAMDNGDRSFPGDAISYGYLIHIPPNNRSVTLAEWGYPEEICPLIRHLQAAGVQKLILDMDAGRIDGFEVWEW